jgi:flagellin-like protein
MNVLEQRVRSWRKARKRGVSPIIATILLVAITVVLAAVLYVLISGLTHGTGSAPLGTNFSWGQPDNVTGSTIQTPSGTALTCTATVTFCYSIEIAGVGGGLTTSSITLALRSASGSTVAWPGAAVVYLVSPTVTKAVATYTISTSSWANTALTGFTGTLAGGFSIVISTGAVTAAGGLYGESIVAIGGNGYSGSVPSNAFS